MIKELQVNVIPEKVTVSPGDPVYLEAKVNSEDPGQFTYEWFFRDNIHNRERQASKSILRI